MRIIETKVYTFDELNDKAKEKALAWWSERYEMLDGDDIVKSIKEFVGLFHGKLEDWSFDWYGGRSSWKVSLPEEVEEISGFRLYKWIVNNGVPYKDNCPLTGMCWDETLLNEVREFMTYPKRSLTAKELIDSGIHNLLKVMEDEYRYQAYGDGAIENIQANEYEFTEDGRRA
jgi:hypothetical protein